MQHASVYLYSNIVELYINPINSVQETYNKVYNRNLKIVRGIDNTIELRVKNSDQRPASLGNDVYLVFNLTDSEDQQHIFQKDCLMKDNTLGIASITLTEHELVGIEPGFYDYTVVQEKREQLESGNEEYIVLERKPTYMDTMFDMKGAVEVLGNIRGEVTPSVVVDTFSYINPEFYGDVEPMYYHSSIINAATDVTNNVHTFQFYYDDEFEGEVIIQASTEKQGATPIKWADIDSFQSTGDNEYINILGKYSWFRIKYIPVTGTIKKVLYR